jgi:thiol:disulfide interchange protein DsbD
MNARSIVRPVVLVAVFLAAAVAHAPEAAAQVRAKAKLFARADGDDVKAAVVIEVEPGFHIGHGPTTKESGEYSLPTTFKMLGEGFEWSAARYPDAEKEPDGVTPGSYLYVHYGTPVFWLRGRKTSPSADLAALSAKIAGQTCDAKGCIPYDETVKSSGAGADSLFAKFPTDLVVGSGGAAAEAPATGPAATSTAPSATPGEAPSSAAASSVGVSPEKLREMGLGSFLGLAVLYGLIALLMPCTYPMIPITISYFTKQASVRHQGLAPLALCYGIGIVVIFTGIGVVVGEAIVKVAFHWATNLVFALMFVAFGLSMIGLFLLQPPQFLLRLSTQATKKGGYGGVFVMGATLVVTSFTCTGPFVGSLLAAGATGERGRVALGMAVFGLTMAVPFVFLALLPGKVKELPKSGEWMHTLKVTLGFVELAAALKFFSNVDIGLQAMVFPRELFLALVGAIFVVIGVYLFGMFRLDEEVEPVVLEPGTPIKLHTSVSAKRLTAGLGFLLFGVYCGYGALGNRMDRVMQSLAPPYHAWLLGGESASKDGATSDAAPVIVKDDLDAACALAAKQRKLVLLNFTGFQ